MILLIFFFMTFSINASEQVFKFVDSTKVEFCKVVDEKDVSFNDKKGHKVKRKNIFIVPPRVISPGEVRRCSKHIINNEFKKDPNIKALSIFFYEKKHQIGNYGFNIAKAIYAPKGEWASSQSSAPMKLKVNFAKKLKVSKKSIATKKTLSVKLKKRIFKGIVSAEDRADKAAYSKHPNNISKQMKLKENLEKSYKKKLLKKHGISEKDLKAISLEGAVKQWPMPRL